MTVTYSGGISHRSLLAVDEKMWLDVSQRVERKGDRLLKVIEWNENNDLTGEEVKLTNA
jgi:hypothetical protein